MTFPASKKSGKPQQEATRSNKKQQEALRDFSQKFQEDHNPFKIKITIFVSICFIYG
jgi:hypothetical protein